MLISTSLMHLLLVEDEKQIAKYLVKGLQRNGFAVDHVLTGKEALSLLAVNIFDCLLLDLNLPDMDGLDIARKLRSDGSQLPILMLTARNEHEDILRGFKSGTDDYLPKPFDFEELLCRIQALIKRNYKNSDSILKTNDIEVNTTNRRVYKGGKEVKINAKEYGILEYLLRNRGKIVSQEELLEHVWDNSIDMFTDTIRANIKTLRQKIDKDKSILRTIRGMGYVID